LNQDLAVIHSQLPSRFISPSSSVDRTAINAVEHFSLFTGKELAGAFSSALWCETLPRIAQHEPSIWYGLVAIGTLDRTNRRDYSVTEQAAIQSYSKSIQEVQKRIEDPTDALCRDTILLASILFAVFECLQGHYRSALSHISSGVKLLSQWQDIERMGTTYADHKLLQAVLLCLDCQAIQLGANDFKDLYARPAIKCIDTSSQPTIEDVNLRLTQIFHRLSHWAHWYDVRTSQAPSKDWLIAEEKQIRLQLDQWDTHFKSLPLGQSATHVLLAQRAALEAAFGRTADGPSEKEWEKYVPQFEKVVEHSERYAQLIEPEQSSSPRPRLTIGPDIVLPLFLAGTRCRDSNVQTRALDLLQRCNRREGIWDSNYYAGCAQMILRTQAKAELDNENARWNRCDNTFGEHEVVKGTVVFQEAA
jgi:hypothetical protein